jgi:diadenylate cyclase
MDGFYITIIAPVLEVLILTGLIYYLLLFIDRISGGGKIKGMAMAMALVVLAAWGAQQAQLYAITALLNSILGFSAIILAIVFQPEMRRMFIRMGRFFGTQEQSATANVIEKLVEAVELMARERIGALIVLERSDHLDNYVAAGPFDCAINVRALQTIFWKNSPVHDGAVIIREGRVVAAGVILPLTQNQEFRALSGTRHRAAIGISEDTDALALVVSEESGAISLADRGSLTRGLTRDELADRLFRDFGARGRRLTRA